VLAGKFPRDAVQDRKVLIGATAVELGDHFSTPLHRSLPGVYLQALAYQSTHNAPLRQLTPPFVYTILLLLLAAYCTCVKRQKWRIQLLISLAAAAAILLLAAQLFIELRLILPVATLLSGIALAQAITWLDNLDRQTLDLIRQRLLLRNRTAVMRAIVHNSMDAILAIDAGNAISDANPAAATLFGYTPHGLLGCAVETVLPHWQRVSAGKNGKYGTRAQTEARQRDGTRLPVEISIGYARLGDATSQFVFLHDITQQLEYERELEYRAGHDSLTGLFNRHSMEKCLADATRLAGGNNTRAGFLLIDLDHFKEINDTLGHPTGDRVLLKIAARMSEYCRDKGVVARIGGDEFGILLECDADIERSARELVAVIRKPLTLDTMTIEVGASIGISVFPDDAADETSLVQHADVAMYLAKELACGYRFYDAAADRHSLRRLAIIARLRESIHEKQLYIVYQPKIALTDRRLVGAEALIRWQHPELGTIPPAEFIPIAEQVGMIDSITLWLIDEVLGYIQAQGPAFDRLSVGVNISAKSLTNPLFPDAILARLRAARVAPARLALEVTETAVIGDPDAALGVLNRLNAAGIVIEIDDFGTGYSSLSYLSRFPARRLKIDRSFIVDMLTSETNHTIVAASIALAHRLGMQTVAEGIEDDETLDALAALGCDYAQGYVISKPLPADVFAAAVATKATWNTGTPVT
jgi:diguanylate cyclase (GGDEF)-like protein/PAS domain S-box-containing protein